MQQFFKTTALFLAVASLVLFTNVLNAEATPSPGAIRQNGPGNYTNLDNNDGTIHHHPDGTYANPDSAGLPVLSTPRNIYYDVDKLPNKIEVKVGQIVYFIQQFRPPVPQPSVSAVPKNTDGGNTVLLSKLDFDTADEGSYQDIMTAPQLATAGQLPGYLWVAAYKASRKGCGEIQVSVDQQPPHKITVNVVKD